jgi:class 3 adenylate cyclase
MPRQRRLLFEDGEDLEVLWERFPRKARTKTVREYARVIARGARGHVGSIDEEERTDEEGD